MRGLKPYQTMHGMRTAIDNGGRFYNLFMDADDRYRGRDFKIHTAGDYSNYTVFSLWDTFRAAHPLYTIIDPKRTRDFILTFLAQYEQGGRLPLLPPGGEDGG